MQGKEATLFVDQQPPLQRGKGDMPPEQRYVRIGSATIYAEISGAGNPLILIHGLGGSTRWWARNVPALARFWRVHVVDLLGFGRSRGQRFVLHKAAELLVHWMDALGLSRASVVGHSMGGLIGAHLAAQSPDRIERLVLVDAAALPLERLSPRDAWRMMRGLQHLPLTLLPVLCADALRAGPRTVLNALRELLRTDISADLARVEAPTLIVWGEHDATLPVAVGRRLQACLRQATFLVIKDAGHCPMWQCPDVFNDAVIQFLKQ
ncbi:MAG TPA: alpha/beta hydrolase [Alphaproteobacteria bacterium]|nr:alpha/beta hydrolase [Alphaproteobacteria bacterium]